MFHESGFYSLPNGLAGTLTGFPASAVLRVAMSTFAGMRNEDESLGRVHVCFLPVYHCRSSASRGYFPIGHEAEQPGTLTGWLIQHLFLTYP